MIDLVNALDAQPSRGRTDAVRAGVQMRSVRV